MPLGKVRRREKDTATGSSTQNS